MRNSRGAQQWAVGMLRTNDAVRIGACLALMLALVESGLTLWLALPLPILAYVGLSLLLGQTGDPAMPPFPGGPVAPSGPAKSARPRTPTRRQAAALATSAQHRDDLLTLAYRISDDRIQRSLDSIQARVGLILDVIEEDHKYEAAPALEELLAKTVNYLTVFEKVVVRRGFTDAEPIAMLRRSFAALAGRFDQFWDEINRDAIVNLRTLREIIDFESELTPFDDEPTVDPASDATSACPPGDERGDPAAEPGRPALKLLKPIEDEVVDQDVVKQAVAELKTVPPNGHGAAGELLTPRELDVLCLVARGKTDQEIAELLFISPRTASTHVQNAKRKLGTRSRTEAALYAVRHSIIDPAVCEDAIGSAMTAQST